MTVGGFSFFTRMSDGGINLASYHPRGCGTWHWSVAIIRTRIERRWWLYSLDQRRVGQWHDYFRLPFGRALCISHQDYHRGQA